MVPSGANGAARVALVEVRILWGRRGADGEMESMREGIDGAWRRDPWMIIVAAPLGYLG